MLTVLKWISWINISVNLPGNSSCRLYSVDLILIRTLIYAHIWFFHQPVTRELWGEGVFLHRVYVLKQKEPWKATLTKQTRIQCTYRALHVRKAEGGNWEQKAGHGGASVGLELSASSPRSLCHFAVTAEHLLCDCCCPVTAPRQMQLHTCRPENLTHLTRRFLNIFQVIHTCCRSHKNTKAWCNRNHTEGLFCELCFPPLPTPFSHRQK